MNIKQMLVESSEVDAESDLVCSLLLDDNTSLLRQYGKGRE